MREHRRSCREAAPTPPLPSLPSDPFVDGDERQTGDEHALPRKMIIDGHRQQATNAVEAIGLRSQRRRDQRDADQTARVHPRHLPEVEPIGEIARRRRPSASQASVQATAVGPFLGEAEFARQVLRGDKAEQVVHRLDTSIVDERGVDRYCRREQSASRRDDSMNRARVAFPGPRTQYDNAGVSRMK